MTRLNMRGLLALVLTVLTLGLGQVPASAQVIGRVPYLSSNPCKGVTLSLAFAKSTGSNCLGGNKYASASNIPGWTYTGGTPAGTGSYAARQDGSLQFFPSYTNLLLQSQTFDNASWTKLASTVTANATTAPDGTATADKLEDAATTNSHGLAISSYGSYGANAYTASVYVKAAEYGFAFIWMDSGSGDGVTGQINLSTGVASVSRGAGGTWGAPTVSSSNAGNGWWRVTITAATSLTSVQTRVYQSPTAFTTGAYGTPSYTGTAGSGIYIWGAQLELGSTASTYIPTTTAAVTVGTPRITDAGYWAEESRTNSIRNSTATGSTSGVIGSGGALPTNWNFSSASSSFTITVNGTGTAEGLGYVEIRLQSASAPASLAIRTETSTGATVTAAAAWTSSIYAAMSAGSTANISSVYAQVETLGGNGSANGSGITLGSTLTRGVATYSSTPAGAAYGRTNLILTFTPGAAVDITLRLAAPQLELGSFATSPIPTTSVAVTRAADVGYVSGLVVPSAVTLRADFSRTAAAASNFGSAASINGGSAANEIYFTRNSSTSVKGYSTAASSAKEIMSATVSSGVDAVSAAVRSAALNGGGAVNGVLATGPDVSTVVVPSSLTILSVGSRSNGATPNNGPIRRIVIYPRAFGNAELQAATIGPVSFANDNAAADDMKAALWGWVA